MRLLTVCVLAVALVGCAEPVAPGAGARDSAPAVAAPTSSGSTGSPLIPPSGPPESAGPEAVPAQDSAAAAKLALDGEGLRAFNATSGASRLIAFGQDEEEAVRALELVLGVAPSDQGENIDCGATLATWPGELTTWFSGGRFVGWSIGRGSGMSSAGGLRLGMSRQQLGSAATTVHIAESTLGTEFDSAGMGGLLDSDRADATVSHLWAGATCIAR